MLQSRIDAHASCCPAARRIPWRDARQQHPFDQSSYQVRFDWGVEGLARLAPSDVVVVVDVLRFSTTVIRASSAARTFPLDAAAHAVSINGARVAQRAAGSGAVVPLGGLRNAAAVAKRRAGDPARARRPHERCDHRGGELASREPGAPLRFAVEDLLGAGAVISALDRRSASITRRPKRPRQGSRSARCGARPGTCVTASGSGRELALPEFRAAAGKNAASIAGDAASIDVDAAASMAAEIAAAAAVDAASVVPVLRAGVFVAF